MRILVTGGAGYIGSHTARLLHDGGHQVVVVDRVAATALEAVAPVTAITGDVGDAALMAETFARHAPDAVIHLAGDKSVEASLRDPGGYYANNVGSTLVLLRCMAAAGVRRMVFSSTCAVYGPVNEPPLTEAAEVDPQTPYGETKLAVERMLHWFDAAHGIRSVSLRYFNAAGAALDGRIGEDWTTAVNLVPMVMKAAAGRIDKLKVYGTDYPTPDGTAVRDYIHVLDLAQAHERAVAYLDVDSASHVLNLGTGQGASVLEVVSATERASGRQIPMELCARRPGDLAAVWADSTRAENVLGWRAKHSLDDIVASAWQWHSRNLGPGS